MEENSCKESHGNVVSNLVNLLDQPPFSRKYAKINPMILAKITIKTNYLIFVGFTAVLVIIQSFIPARLGRFVW